MDKYLFMLYNIAGEQSKNIQTISNMKYIFQLYYLIVVIFLYHYTFVINLFQLSASLLLFGKLVG